MKVIFAGYSKCGTKTMAEALRILGYNVYDFMENYEYLGDKWMKVFKEGGTKDDFYEMYKDVDAVTDMPAFYFWNQILEAFPDAKIVFCERPEDEWYASMLKQKESGEGFIMRFLGYMSPTNYRLNAWAMAMFKVVTGMQASMSLFGERPFNELLMKHSYRMHNAYVKKCAPKDQLLEFNIKDGWKPLCEFLKVSIPDTEFPHKNKKGSITQELMETNPLFIRMQREMAVSCTVLAGLTVFCFYKGFTNRSFIMQTCNKMFCSLQSKFNI